MVLNSIAQPQETGVTAAWLDQALIGLGEALRAETTVVARSEPAKTRYGARAGHFASDSDTSETFCGRPCARRAAKSWW